MPLSIVDPIDL